MPTFADVLAARDLLKDHLPETPMWSYPLLDRLTGATVYIKHENVQPIGAFKVRGGITLLAALAAEERFSGEAVQAKPCSSPGRQAPGREVDSGEAVQAKPCSSPGRRPLGERLTVVSYSTGNHAQSIAYACALFDTPCVIAMPAQASATKADAVRALGGTVVLHGANMADAQTRAEEWVASEGGLLISPGDTPALIAGVGTLYLEIFERHPDLDLLVVPVGSGSGAAAAGLVAAKLAPSCGVVGVQSSASPAAFDSYSTGTCVERPNRTIVEGLATGRGFALPQSLMRTGLADFHLVTDAQIAAAQRILAGYAHTLAEGAGAAALAAVLARPEYFAGKRIAIVCTGGNASAAEIAALALA